MQIFTQLYPTGTLPTQRLLFATFRYDELLNWARGIWHGTLKLVVVESCTGDAYFTEI